MYLSRIVLDVHHPSVRQALRDCNDMHRNLMRAFPASDNQVSPRNEAGLLYRLITKRDEVSLLVASAHPPDGEALQRNGFSLEAGKDISALKDRFQAGQTLRFELIASPCKKIAGDGKNSRRVFLRTPEERADWLRRQGEKYGFSLCAVQEDGQQITFRGKRKSMCIDYGAVRFTGVLRIVSPADFWKAYCAGIGPGKAYGLGMLTLSRL